MGRDRRLAWRRSSGKGWCPPTFALLQQALPARVLSVQPRKGCRSPSRRATPSRARSPCLARGPGRLPPRQRREPGRPPTLPSARPLRLPSSCCFAPLSARSRAVRARRWRWRLLNAGRRGSSSGSAAASPSPPAQPSPSCARRCLPAGRPWEAAARRACPPRPQRRLSLRRPGAPPVAEESARQRGGAGRPSCLLPPNARTRPLASWRCLRPGRPPRPDVELPLRLFGAPWRSSEEAGSRRRLRPCLPFHDRGRETRWSNWGLPSPPFVLLSSAAMPGRGGSLVVPSLGVDQCLAVMRPIDQHIWKRSS